MSPHLTAEGFVFCEGRAGRACVLPYRRGDGTTYLELIPEEELFNEESLATLGRKPITLEHPPDGEDVTPENYQDFAIGDIGSKVSRREGGYVVVDLAIRRDDGINAWKNGVNQLSMGYTCKLDKTPGVHPVHGRYDAIQRQRRYNHLALTRMGRAGPDTSIRRDSAVEVPGVTVNPKLLLLLSLLGVRRADASDASLDEAAAKVGEMQEAIKTATPVASIAEMKAKIAALEAEIASEKAKLASLESETVKPAEIEAIMDADPMAMPATPDDKKRDAVRGAVIRASGEHQRLVTMAKDFNVPNVDKLGNAGLRKAVVGAANPTARRDADDVYYRAAIDMLPEVRRDADPYAAIGDNLARGTEAPADKRRDADPRDDADPVTTRMRTRFAQVHST